jgi:hypothetical protein
MDTKKTFYYSLEPSSFFTDENFILMNSAERGLFWTICLYLYDKKGKWTIEIGKLKTLANWQDENGDYDAALKKVNQSFKTYRRSLKITYAHHRVTKEVKKAQAARQQRVNAANSRWGNDDSDDAAALRPQCGRTQSNGSEREGNREESNSKKSDPNPMTFEFIQRYDTLEKHLTPRTKSDQTVLRKIVFHLIKQDAEWPRVLAIATLSQDAIKPMAYFQQSIKTEFGDYRNAHTKQA